MNYVRPPRVIDRDEQECCEYWKVFWEKYERMGGKYRLPPCPIPVDDPDYYVKLNEWYKDHHHKLEKLTFENLNKNQMKTAKVTQVHNVKPFNGQNGLTYYCNVTMDNGDEINIGKKKEVAIGDTLNYEITDTEGQQRFKKSKSVQPQSYQNGNSFQNGNSSQFANHDLARQKAIILQSSLQRAVELWQLTGTESTNPSEMVASIKKISEELANFVIEKSGI